MHDCAAYAVSQQYRYIVTYRSLESRRINGFNPGLVNPGHSSVTCSSAITMADRLCSATCIECSCCVSMATHWPVHLHIALPSRLVHNDAIIRPRHSTSHPEQPLQGVQLHKQGPKGLPAPLHKRPRTSQAALRGTECGHPTPDPVLHVHRQEVSLDRTDRRPNWQC